MNRNIANSRIRILPDLNADGDIGTDILFRVGNHGETIKIHIVSLPANFLNGAGLDQLRRDALLLQRQVPLQQLLLRNPQSQRHQFSRGKESP